MGVELGHLRLQTGDQPHELQHDLNRQSNRPTKLHSKGYSSNSYSTCQEIMQNSKDSTETYQ